MNTQDIHVHTHSDSVIASNLTVAYAKLRSMGLTDQDSFTEVTKAYAEILKLILKAHRQTAQDRQKIPPEHKSE